jgi:outer membrane protein assembly factor BamB
LIFTATNDKKLRTYDQDTGKVVWEFNLPAAGAYIAFVLPKR